MYKIKFSFRIIGTGIVAFFSFWFEGIFLISENTKLFFRYNKTTYTIIYIVIKKGFLKNIFRLRELESV